MARFGGRVCIDLGTGDGRLPHTLAREAPERLFVGVDANAAALREVSGRAARAGLDNLVYIRAAVESLPSELAGVADRITIVLPWGSLLPAAMRPTVEVLRSVRGLCRRNAILTVVASVDPERDGAELRRLGMPEPDGDLRSALEPGYATAGFEIRSVRSLDPQQLAHWPSTWARRLAHGRPRATFEIEARAEGQSRMWDR